MSISSGKGELEMLSMAPHMTTVFTMSIGELCSVSGAIALFAWACLTYKPYFFSQRTVFFSHTKSANSTFSHDLSAKQAQTNMALKSEGTQCSWQKIFVALFLHLAFHEITG